MEQLAITIGIKGLLFIIGVCAMLGIVALASEPRGEEE